MEQVIFHPDVTNAGADSCVDVTMPEAKRFTESGVLSGGLSVIIVVAAVVAGIFIACGARAVEQSRAILVSDNESVRKPITSEDVMALVVRLGDGSFQVRQQATTDLWRMGKDALPALHQAAEGRDPEVTDRARELILYITAGVLPDSPQEVKDLVIRFSRSKVEGKLVILRRLLEMGRWKQVLHLARLEPHSEMRKKMSAIVGKAASGAAREAIARGDYKLADEILELSSDDARAMAMRAWFLCCRGLLDQHLERARSMPGRRGALWRMSLYRASGNAKAAIREAEKAGRQDIADALRVLEGDAMPWLIRGNRASELDVIYSMGCRIQRHRMEGNKKRAAVMARELAMMALNEDSADRVVVCLAANGFRENAIDLLVRHDRAGAFEYFDSTEMPRRSLDVLAIPRDAKPPYTRWVREFTEKAIEEEDEKLYEQLLMLAHFLISRGEGEHGVAVLTPMMRALEEDGSDAWFDLITTMTTYGMGEQAIHFVGQRGNEDGEADLGVRKMLRAFPSEALSHVWEVLKRRNKQEIPKALQEFALLSGVIADPENSTEKLHKALVEEVADAAPDVKYARTSALFSFCVKRNDIAEASRMADKLAVENDRWVRSRDYLDAALLRWGKVEPRCSARAKAAPQDYTNLAGWSLALRKLGRADRAAEVQNRALMISMGSPIALARIGWNLHDVGYGEDAVKMWKQAAMLAEPGSSEFDSAIRYLAHYGQALYHTGQWKTAAAIAEVNIRLMMRGRGSLGLHTILRARFYADFCHAMLQLERGKRASAFKMLDDARKLVPGDGALADEFFPMLREAGVGRLYDQWFEDSYRHIAAACKLYPEAHNSHNTAAWLASRAVRRLDDALLHSKAALEARPTQGAYLDTMAEIWFARGNRAKAVEWSEKAVACSIGHANGNPRSEQQVLTNFKQLHLQLERFKKGPLPQSKR